MHTLAIFATSTLAAVAALASTGAALPAPGGGPGEFEPSVWGLELQVDDVAAAARAWRDAFGFEPVLSGGEIARLEKDGLVLVLVRSDAPGAPEDAASIYLNLRAQDLDAAMARATRGGARIPEAKPRPNRIGREVTAFDPSGNPVNLMHLSEAQGQGPPELSVYDVGVNFEPGADGDFLERLGFRAQTRAYLPATLPIERAGAAPLVIHRQAARPRARGTRSTALLLGVERIEPAREELAERGIEVGPSRATPVGRRAALSAPSGVRIELVERSPAQLAFERIAALAGSWEGKSSQGWTSRAEIEVIARGSAVLERTNFEAHPGETMLTLFHLDGERLLLTHYCVAGNQPRLVASEIGSDRLHFTFLDATNISSRDQGHMDEAVLRFPGNEAFSSVWSFYRDGKTSWMEEIRYRRLGAPEGSKRGG